MRELTLLHFGNFSSWQQLLMQINVSAFNVQLTAAQLIDIMLALEQIGIYLKNNSRKHTKKM